MFARKYEEVCQGRPIKQNWRPHAAYWARFDLLYRQKQPGEELYACYYHGDGWTVLRLSSMGAAPANFALLENDLDSGLYSCAEYWALKESEHG